MAETPIEAIESSFKAPDVPIDFYGNTDSDLDDYPWNDFVNNYRFDKIPDHEEDEDGDPDYIAADKAPVDKEELRQPEIPQKELEDLLEAHQIDSSFLKAILDIDFGEQLNDAPNSPLSTSVKSGACTTENASDKLLSEGTSNIFSNAAVTHQTTLSIQASGESAPSASSSYFDTTTMSTPMHAYTMPMEMKGAFEQQIYSNQTNNAQIADVAKSSSVMASLTNATETYPHAGSDNSHILNGMNNPSTMHFVTAIESNTSSISSSMPSNSISASQQFIFLLSATSTVAAPSTPTLSTQNNLPLSILNRQIEAGGLQRPIATSKRTRFKKDRFSELENLDPHCIAAAKVRRFHCK